MTPHQILVAMQPHDWPGVYVVGCFDRRITFYAQQARALTLIKALFDDGDLCAEQSVGVIGGGAAGITAAVAAMTRGCRVVLYEAGDGLLRYQYNSVRRYIHPHLYDWPQEGTEIPDAGLPLLNWSANDADHVACQLRNQVDEYAVQSGEALKIRTNSHIIDLGRLHAPQGHPRVQLIGNEGDINESFHVVIIAIGFGAETTSVVDHKNISYWTGDDIQGAASAGEKRRILISGAGDGGLIDLARATLNDFRQDKFLAALTAKPGLLALAGAMYRIDQTASKSGSYGSQNINLYKRYCELKIDGDVFEAVTNMKRSDTEVTFNHSLAEIFSLESALINRLIGLLLIRAKMVQRVFGKIVNIESQRDRYRVSIYDRPDMTRDYDLVVLRHGTSAHYFSRCFPQSTGLVKACTELGGKLAELGLTGTLDLQTRAWYTDTGPEKVNAQYPLQLQGGIATKGRRRLGSRREYVLACMDLLRSTKTYRATVVGPLFLHPIWYSERRAERRQLPDYERSVYDFVIRHCATRNSDVRIILRNTARYLAKVDELVKRQERSRFKADVLDRIDEVWGDGTRGPDLCCHETGHMRVEIIFDGAFIESYRPGPNAPLAGGRLSADIDEIADARARFDEVFDGSSRGQLAEINKLKAFVRELWQ